MRNIPYTLEGTDKLVTFVTKNKINIDDALSEYGAVLLRGFKIYSLSEFQKVSEILCNDLFDYVYRSSPRVKLGGKVYTSTEYPKEREILLHNENSYTLSWPKKILFHCVIAPRVSGETPIANSSRVYQLIDPSVRDEFIRRKIMYVRNYGLGMDLSWQEAFQTELKADVEKFCQSHQINFTWFGNDKLRTYQICQAVLSHPVKHDMIWFNQAHLFHESANDTEMREYFSKNYKYDEIPRNALFGDGVPISEEVLDHIRRKYREAEIVFPWHKGDLLILDNLLYAHGRRPFEGERKIVVSMGN